MSSCWAFGRQHVQQARHPLTLELAHMPERVQVFELGTHIPTRYWSWLNKSLPIPLKDIHGEILHILVRRHLRGAVGLWQAVFIWSRSGKSHLFPRENCQRREAAKSCGPWLFSDIRSLRWRCQIDVNVFDFWITLFQALLRIIIVHDLYLQVLGATFFQYSAHEGSILPVAHLKVLVGVLKLCDGIYFFVWVEAVVMVLLLFRGLRHL